MVKKNYIFIVLLLKLSCTFTMESNSSEEESPTSSFIIVEPERELKQTIRELKEKLAKSNVEFSKIQEQNDRKKSHALRSGSAKCIKMYSADEQEQKTLLDLQEYYLVSEHKKHYFETLVRYNNLCLFKRFSSLDINILQGVYRIALSQKSKKFINHLENTYPEQQLLNPEHILELMQVDIKHHTLGSLKLLFTGIFWKSFFAKPPHDKRNLLKYGFKKSKKCRYVKGEHYFQTLKDDLKKTTVTLNAIANPLKTQSLQLYPHSVDDLQSKKAQSAFN